MALHRACHAETALYPSRYCHVITFLSVGAAYRLGLHDRYALVFGVIVGYVASGIDSGTGADFEQDRALQLLAQGAAPGSAPLGTLFTAAHWEDSQAGFARIFAPVLAWLRSRPF